MSDSIYDVIIVGSGPAGYTAGIYSGRARLKTLMLSGEQFGGQLMKTTEVENFPGFEHGIMGPKLMMEMRKQMQRFGVEIIDVKVNSIKEDGDLHVVSINEDSYVAKTVIIATGAEALRLNLKGEDSLVGKGVSTCAVCDAAFYRDKIVYVVGGGDSAVEDTMALTKFAKKVYMVVRRDKLRASKIMQDRVMNHKSVEILWNHEVVGLKYDQTLNGLILLNNITRNTYDVETDGLFYAIGHVPNSAMFDGYVKIDDRGYILTSLNGLNSSSDMHSIMQSGFPTMTSKPGVFAAGDVVDFRYRQAITSAGAGCQASLDVERYIESKE